MRKLFSMVYMSKQEYQNLLGKVPVLQEEYRQALGNLPLEAILKLENAPSTDGTVAAAFEEEKRRFQQAQRELEAVLQQLDDMGKRFAALYQHTTAVLRDNTSIKAARAAHEIWLDKEGRERLGLPPISYE